LKMSDAMLFKRELGTNCNLDVKMLDTLNDGFILIIEQELVNGDSLALITSFVTQHKLSLLLDSERYFISTKALSPSSQHWWDS